MHDAGMTHQSTASTHETTPSTALTERDAAVYLNYSRAYLRVSRRMGRGPAFIRIGRSIRYRIQDLDQWLAAHRVSTRTSR
jgi:predicted DNA-binding transcriptional regulator AlpA